MRRQGRRWLAIALAGMLALVVACGGRSPDSATPPDRPDETTSSCHVVSHAKGETCVPSDPQRVVALGNLEYVLALGVQPIGSDDVTSPKAYLKDEVEGITNVGGGNAPSLEKILSLKPDLILGGEYLDLNYRAMSQIAPTVLVPFDYSGEWKRFFREVAIALDRRDQAEQVMAEYDARIEEFQRAMGGAERLSQLDVSIVRVYPDRVNLYLKDSFCGTIVADAGLSRPPSQDLTAAEANALTGNPIQYSISRERLLDADGDVIFLWTYGGNDQLIRQAHSQKARLQTDPLWSQLQAVQQGRVYEVPSYWIGDGPLAANAVLDDLFKYLVED
ncbi:putative siderophore-binding lipoprotein YfiY [Halomicronema hongdechloris C2206]|uniref:Siderophore-binding lipoprotein YfiY n=1 Tax=Halomicronema hongdechloris C2206 TaxID=1641165 RepID=A0A1Z3HN89_9CYAN|nr:iron-siderophore ABC transporter substrate-binding protein [Halomicronema hongdechloris]ASC71759.1 putative siderophore-binding lipoprotein YfiY [Halomicronema hongdechloris C2206]